MPSTEADGGRYLALLRFWSECRHDALQALQARESPDHGIDRPRVRWITPLRGSFDLAAEISGTGSIVSAGAAALSLASVLTGGASSPGQDCASAEALEALADLPVGTPVNLWRARDGWILISATDPQQWLTLSMTFLNLNAYHGYRAGQAWHAPAVNELATMVLDTHRVLDAEGTCLTYGIPAAAVPAWRDELAPPGMAKRLSEKLAYAALIIW